NARADQYAGAANEHAAANKHASAANLDADADRNCHASISLGGANFCAAASAANAVMVMVACGSLA
ncbi:MAG: hypothetical protein KC432_06970, partial [Thermomicrobiales bacterium]|nr:hypothetical protein [Thermomicrobiales bacterium]